MPRTVFDADKVEERELDGEAHCFIVRLGDDQFEAVQQHRARLARVLRKPVSRAAAVRELIGRVLPRRKREPDPRQVELFGRVLGRNPLVAVEAQRVVARAAERLIRR